MRTAKIKWIDNKGVTHSIPARLLKKHERWGFCCVKTVAENDNRGIGAKCLGDGFGKSEYTGGMMGILNEVPTGVYLLADGVTVVEIKYFPGFNCDLVIREGKMDTLYEGETP